MLAKDTKHRSGFPAERRLSLHGFTFAEILAAMLFVAIVLPVAVRGITLANRVGVLAERKQVAAQLADNLLTEFIVTEEWRNSNDRGDFEPDWPQYSWTFNDAAWDEDTMRLLTVEVFFEVQGRQHSVRISALVDETEDEETETDTDTDTEETES